MNYTKIIETCAMFGMEGEETTDFLRFVCPFRKEFHPDPRGAGNFVYSFGKDTLRGKCWVCGDTATLPGLIFFLAVRSKNPKLIGIAYDFVDYLHSVSRKDPVARSFSSSEGVVEIKTKSPREELRERMLDLQKYWYAELPVMNNLIVEYLTSRGMGKCSDILIEDFGLKYDTQEARMVIPRIDMLTGEYWGAEGRAVIASKKKIRSYEGSMIHNTFLHPKNAVGEADAFVVCEGWGDVFNMWCFGRISGMTSLVPLGVGSSNLSDRQIEILEYLGKPVFLLFDNDKAGRRGSRKAVARLDSGVPLVRELTLPKGVDDPGELGESEYIQVMEKIV